MSITRGESYAVGVALEDTRGTYKEPTAFVKTNEPNGLKKVTEKLDIKEAGATGVATQGQVITKQKVEGALPFYLRFNTAGYFLASLLGDFSTATEAGETVVYRHTFNLDTSVTQPTLSFAMARGGLQHKAVNGAVVPKIMLSAAIDDAIKINAEVMARDYVDHADYTPAYDGEEIAPRHTLKIKVANDVAGLNAAPSICLTETELNLERGAREKMCINSLTPVDYIAQLLNIAGKFVMDKEDDTYQDLSEANTSKAIEISIINTDVTIGTSSNPSLIITLPKVTFVTEEERNLDDAVKETVNFTAHYDDTEAKAITATLINTIADYTA